MLVIGLGLLVAVSGLDPEAARSSDARRPAPASQPQASSAVDASDDPPRASASTSASPDSRVRRDAHDPSAIVASPVAEGPSAPATTPAATPAAALPSGRGLTIAGAVLLSGGFSAATLGAYFLIAAATQPPDPTERDDPRRLYGGLALAFAAVELAAGAPLLAVGLARRTRRVVLTPTFGPTPSGAIGGVHLRF